MADIWLLYCPRCLVTFPTPRSVVLSREARCEWCVEWTNKEAADEYDHRLASARVWYTVPETYEVKEG